MSKEKDLVVPAADWIAVVNKAARLREQLEKSNQIVRRLAEVHTSCDANLPDLMRVMDDAVKLWAEMQKGGGDE
jgi:ABC-type transporter Mla subunit MlaD